MPLSAPQLFFLSLIAMIGLAVALVLISIRLQGQRLKAVLEQARTQGLIIEATHAARFLVWAEDPTSGGLHLPPSPILQRLPQVPPDPGLQDLVAWIPEPSRPSFHACQAIAQSCPGIPQSVKLPLRSVMGGVVETEWTLCMQNGRLQGVIRDITAEVRMQDQLIQAQRQEAVASLVAGISHEFGNVLGAVDSCSAALLAQPIEGDARRAGELIQASAQRGRGVIRQLMDLSRPRASQPVVTDLNRLLRDLESLLTNLIPKQIRVVLDLDPALPPLTLDPALLHQALLNLSLNARDAMPQGGTLTLRSAMDAGAPLLQVVDTGGGMDAATQARIFEPFFTTKEPGRGTGLGLSITKGIVEGMGGSLLCASDRGHGTAFSVRFPAISGADSLPQAATSGASTTAPQAGLPRS